MVSRSSKTEEPKSVNAASQLLKATSADPGFVDSRPAAVAQRRLQAQADNSPQVQQAAQLQARADRGAAQEPVQRQENRTGLPDQLKSGVESLSGHSLDDVQVHYNSSKPTELQAHAYAQGTDIHLAPGQEQHLPHEAWHVVQQKQGRVQPTRQLKAGVPVNDDTGLEYEADVMGAKANSSLPDQSLQTASTVAQMASASPIQRRIRLGNSDEDVALAEAEVVPDDLALSSAGAVIYLRQRNDDADHHYADQQAMITTIENAAQPSTRPFADIFTEAAEAAHVDIHWLEQYLNDLGSTLLALNQETPADIVEKITVRNPASVITVEDIEGFSLEELMEQILQSNIMTLSCGQTANLIHTFLSPSTAAVAPEPANLPAVLDAIRTANETSAQELNHQYVKVEGGGHAFLVEVFNDQCKLLQSFFGRYSFAKDLERNKVYPLEDFLSNLEQALTSSPLSEAVPHDVRNARVELFSSEAVHPDGDFKINTFAPEADSEQRVLAKAQEQAQEWDARLPEPAMNHLSAPQVEEPAAAGPPVTVMKYDFALFNGLLTITGAIADGKTEQEMEELIETGALPVGTQALWDQHTFSLTSKTATQYEFRHVP